MMKSSRTWISIHAPREGGDFMFLRRGPPYFKISIHAPREGGDEESAAVSQESKNFNPRPPRGGRLMFLRRGPPYFKISIHAPREGGDQY